MRRTDSIHSKRVVIDHDCDSEGNDPPEGTFVDPETIDDSAIPPPRGNQQVVLPFFQPRDRRRVREQYESKIGFEDWVEDAEDVSGRSKKSGVIKLEDDSDSPVGRPYYWHAYCATCNITYYPHIPGQWSCRDCKGKVWQPPDDPESKSCAVCRRDVAPIREIKGHRIRNPVALNAHLCKRCGRVICDHCYSPQTFPVSELGYTEPQRICTMCVKNINDLRKPPAEEDLGTLYEERVVGDVIERNMCHRYWVPKCSHCNITFGEPPPRWLCTSCARPVWQPPEATESNSCWLCGNLHPKVRCHDCGQLACYLCGAYAQPLLHRGFINGNCLSVCKGCYKGQSVVTVQEVPFKTQVFRAGCIQCKQTLGTIPDMWLSRCHKAKAWQVECTSCAVCAVALAPGAGDNCRRCGRLACPLCTQYKEPVTDRGYAKEKPETICRECYHPKVVMQVGPFDFPFWPPYCERCNTTFPRPPERWRCPNQCGAVWQGPDHVASKACWSCGKKLGGGVVNCRKCGRMVCATCGEGRSEIPELGFTRGVQYPTCRPCIVSNRAAEDSQESTPTPSVPPPASSATDTQGGAGAAAATPPVRLGGTGNSPRGATPASAARTTPKSVAPTPGSKSVTPAPPK